MLFNSLENITSLTQKEFETYLDKELNQDSPSKNFTKKVQEELLNIFKISYLAGIYYFEQKKEKDDKAAEEAIENCEYVCEAWTIRAYAKDLEAAPDFKNMKPSKVIEWLKNNILLKTSSYLTKIEKKTKGKIDVIEKLIFYDNAKHLTDIIKKSMETGETIRDTIKRIQKSTLLETAGIHTNNKYYLETVVRTNQASAVMAAKKEQADNDPDTAFYRYVAIEDSRTSKVCKDLAGIVKKVDWEGWSVYFPPNHFNCRSNVTTISKLYAETLNIKESKKSKFIDTDPGFNVDPSKTWSAPTVEMRTRLAEHLNVKVSKIPKGSNWK